jgi:autotransporter adhesin
LTYKIQLSSTASYLSPVIDLRVASVKTSSNRIENAAGKEDRFGKRYQILSFLPVYRFLISGTTENIEINQTIEGLTSGARGKIVKAEGQRIWVKITSPSTFTQQEYVFLSTQSQDGGILEGVNLSIANNSIVQESFTFEIGSTIVALIQVILIKI